MDTHKGGLALYKLLNRFFLVLGCYAALSVHEVHAFDWRIRPNLSMSEIFSDNLNLSENAKKSGFVSEISPGLSMYGQSPWSNFNLNYNLQGLYNAGGRDAVDINHQLRMNSLYQVVRNTFFIQGSSSISQQNISNAFVATDNVSGNGNRTEVKTFSISPYFTPHFGQYGSGLFKVGYDRTSFDNAQNSQNLTQLNSFISDTETISKQARLSSGSYFNRVKWNLNYSSRDQNQANGNDVTFEQYMADGRYYINHKFNVFAQGGEENNHYQTLNNNIKNGFFYTVGGQWSPSRWYSLEAGIGNNKHVTMLYNPSANLSSNITYRNKDVGLNSGSSWDADIRYRVGQAKWSFKYSQDTTTVQESIRQLGYGTDAINDYGKLMGFAPIVGAHPLFPYSWELSALTDSVIVVKRANLSFDYQTGKSNFDVSAYYQNNIYETSTQSSLNLVLQQQGLTGASSSTVNDTREDSIYGLSGRWQWQLDPRLNFYLQPMWQSTDGIVPNKRYDVALGLMRSIPINLGRPLQMNTKLELRHIQQSSDNTGFDYTENRATANFAVRF